MPVKLVKINIAFKCPMEECMAGEDTNGTECLRCVLIHIIGDQKTWEEVQANRPRPDGSIDITMNDLPNITPGMTEKDLQFLAGSAGILMGQKEWFGDALEEAVRLYSGSSHFRETVPVIDITEHPALTDTEHDTVQREPEE